MTASGHFCWPPAGRFVTAYGQDLMAAGTHLSRRSVAPPMAPNMAPSGPTISKAPVQAAFAGL